MILIPNLSTSYLGPDAAPNSTLQHVVSSCTGQRDHLSPQLMVDSGACIIINGERDFLWPFKKDQQFESEKLTRVTKSND